MSSFTLASSFAAAWYSPERKDCIWKGYALEPHNQPAVCSAVTHVSSGEPIGWHDLVISHHRQLPSMCVSPTHVSHDVPAHRPRKRPARGPARAAGPSRRAAAGADREDSGGVRSGLLIVVPTYMASETSASATHAAARAHILQGTVRRGE